jgi:small-conductance mechanosensitive channel
MNLNFIVYDDVTLIDILIALLILIVGALLAKAISIRIRRVLKDKVDRGPREIASKGTYYIIILFAVFASIQILGVDLSGLLLVGGLLAIAIGFAAQSAVSNLISGIFLSVDRPFNVGQAIEIDGTSGIVEEVRILSTRIRTFEGVYTRLPNEKVFSSKIQNFDARVTRRFEYTIGIRYKDDASKAIEIIKNVMDSYPLVLVEPVPQIFVNELGDSSVNITVRCFAPSSEWYNVKMEMLWKLKTGLEENGISVPFPQRELWFNQPLEIKRKKLKG